MKTVRYLPTLLIAAAALSACEGPSKKELQATNTIQADSLNRLRNELLEQVMQGTQFVNEINHELLKSRTLASANNAKKPKDELTDPARERKEIVTKIEGLVARLDQVQARIATARAQLSEKDSVLAAKITAYEQMVAEINQTAEKQRLELQAVIDRQTTQIASLSSTVDTLKGTVGQLTEEKNTVYVVMGTKDELIKKGILVQEGPRRFLLAGARPVVPARELDPSVFTKLDRTVDTAIVLPAGEYKIVSRQSSSYVTPVGEKGTVSGALKIEKPEQFWSSSRFLILVRS